MPSHRTRVRLAPDDPMPRSETPFVVGLATRLEGRRNSVKPGTSRRRSSMLTPGVCARVVLVSTLTAAGVSAEIVAVTVMDSLRGSILGLSDEGGFGSWFWPPNHSGVIRTNEPNIILVQIPARCHEPLRRSVEDNLKHVLVMRGRKRFSLSGEHQSQILQNSVDVSLFRAAKLDVLADEAEVGAAAGHGPGEVSAAVDGTLEPGVLGLGHVDVQEKRDRLFLFVRELPDLQVPGVRGRFPVHVARALERFVGAYAIEVVTVAPN